MAPAALLRQFLPGGNALTLAAPTGTLWDGEAVLVMGGRDAGQLAWRFAPVTILQGALGYDLRLEGPAQSLAGELRLRVGGMEVSLDGTAQGDYLNAWLGAYDIDLTGTFTFDAVRLDLPYHLAPDATAVLAPGTAQGRLSWTGGPVRYRLSGQQFAGELPPLEAVFGEGLEALVRQAQGVTGTESAAPTPLLRVEVLANGYVRIGMTRLLTRLLNNPWPGSDADHEVVLQVEERLLPLDTPG
jgi:hypothetical protein